MKFCRQTLPRVVMLVVLVLVSWDSVVLIAASETWSEPINLSNSAGSPLAPSIAVDKSGNIHVAWSEQILGTSNVFYTRWNGTSWSSPAMLNTDAVMGPHSIAADSLGNLHMIYHSDLTYYRMFDGISWTDPVPISEEIRANIQWASIAVDLSNNPHVVFPYSLSGNDSTIYYSTWDGLGWSEPQALTAITANSFSYQPRIAVDYTGTVHVVWTDLFSHSIYYRNWNGLSWSSPTLLSIGTAGNPDIATDSAGNIHVVWESGGVGDIYYTWWNGSSWSTPSNVSDTTFAAAVPSLAVDPNDNLHLVWANTISGQWDIFHKKWGGSSWSPSTNVSRNSTTSTYPAIAVDTNGGIHVVWQDLSPLVRDIFYSTKAPEQVERETWSFTPPYDSCVASTAQLTESPPVGRPEVIALGFSDVDASCNPETGTINYSTLVFGGKKGHIFQPPSQFVKARADMGFEFTPPFTGNLNVEATVKVNAKLGAAAGSATALLDVRDIILLFLPDKLLKAFIEIAEQLILETFAGTRTDAFIKVGEEESSVLVKGVGASFPVPPWRQVDELSEHETTVSLTIPVTEGEPIYIQAGLRSETKAHGWSVSWWNPRGTQDSVVSSIVLTRQE